MRPFRFGVKLRQSESAAQWRSAALEIESLGYDTLLTPDHLGPQLAPLIAASAAATVTTRLRIGTSVLGNDFRHPVMLAKEALSLDLLSGGRFELGLGAGWMQSDYDALGTPMDPPARRIERLAEAVEILRACFSGGPVRYRGRHYRVEGLASAPPATQPGGPPLLLGGGGRRMLSLASRQADIVGINPTARPGASSAQMDLDATAEATDRKLAWVREGAGERYSQLELCMQVYCVAITDRRSEADRALAARYAMPLEQARGIPGAWTGSLEAIGDALELHRERWGLSYWIVPPDAYRDLAPLVTRLRGR